jgi:Kef-type K+ transport system membrane component KefB
MRQIFVIVSLLMAMLGLKSLGIENQEGFEPLFLAALGFVILSAFSSAEIVTKINLPKVTGFILAGIILGPQVSNILSAKIVSDTKMFTTLALGLIALSAGLELQLGSLKKIANTLGLVILFKFIFLFTVVLFGFYICLHSLNMPIELTSPQMFALSLIFSALAIGTSPAISLAVINESKIKSRMADITLGMAVVKDVLVVLTLAVCLTLAKTLVNPDSLFSSEVLVGLAEEIFSSLFFGALLGALIILYLKFIKREMLLFVTLVIIGVAEISSLLHLELLLVFIVAGFVVTNFSKLEDELLSPIEKVSLPVFIIFFTNAGASIDLLAIQKILPIALCLFALRAIAFYFSSYLGSRIAKEDENIVKNSWLCFLPQAGVTLGLVGVAAKQIPEMGLLIENVGMGLVGLNLIVGPVSLRMGLNRTQEVDEISYLKKEKFTGERAQLSLKLNEICENYLQRRKLKFEEHIKNLYVLPAKEIIADFVYSQYQEKSSLLENIEKFETMTDRLSNKNNELLELRSARVESFEELPQVFEEDMESKWLKINLQDPFRVRFNKRILQIKKTFGVKLRKYTLVRACFRKYLYVHFIQNERTIIEKWMQTLFLINNAFESRLHGEISGDAFLEKTNESLQQFYLIVTKNYVDDLNVEERHIKNELDISGSPYISKKNLRFSKYSARVRQIEEKVNISLKRWQKVFSGYRNQMIVKNKLNSIQSVTEEQIKLKVVRPVEVFIEHTLPEITQSEEQIQSLKKQFIKNEFSLEKISIFLKQMRDDLERQRLSVDRVIEHGFEKSIFSAISHLSHLDKNYKIVTPQFTLNPDPNKAEFKVINLSETIMLQIEGKLVPELSRQASTLHQQMMKQIYQYLDLLDRMILRSEGLDAVSGLEIDEVIADFNVDIKLLQNHLENLNANLMKSLDDFKSKKTELLNEIFSDFDSLETREIYYSQTSSKLIKIYGKASLKYKAIKNKTIKKMQIVFDKFKFAKNEFVDSEISKEVKSKVKENKIDSATIKKYLSFIYQKPILDSVPQTYRRLFSLEELYDDRFFTNEKLTRDLLYGGTNTNKYLVVGEAGSGKSTALNVLAKKYNYELIEIRRNSYWRQISILESIANTLNCKKDVNSILKVLNEKQRTILIDDLNIWWRPSQISEMDQFFDLLSKTQDKTVWLASIGSLGYKRLKDTFQFTLYFEEHIFLEKIEKTKTLEFIQKRHRYSGRELHFPETLSNRYLKNIARRGNEKLFLQYIYELSHGNPRLLSFLWLKSIKTFSSKEVRTTFKNVEIANFDFIDIFSESKKLILMEIASFQSRSLQDLIESLALDSDEIKKDLDYLERSLLITSAKSYYQLPPLIDSGVEQFITRLNYGK